MKYQMKRISSNKISKLRLIKFSQIVKGKVGGGIVNHSNAPFSIVEIKKAVMNLEGKLMKVRKTGRQPGEK